MKVELTKVRIKDGKGDRVGDWFEYINETRDDVALTFAGDRVYVESMFRITEEESDFIYWYTLAAGDEDDVKFDDAKVDKIHLQFWDECIDKKYRPRNYNADVSLYSHPINKFLRKDSE